MKSAKCRYCGKEIKWSNDSLDKLIPVWKAYEVVGEKIIPHNCIVLKTANRKRWIKDHMKEIIEKKKMDREFKRTIGRIE